MSSLKIRKSYRILCICLTVLSGSNGWTKIPVDYNGNPIPKDRGVVLTPQSIYYNGLLHAVSSPQLAGYLQQTFGGYSTPAPSGALYITPRIGGGANDQITGMVVQPDGKIVVGGYTSPGGILRCAIARFLPNGQLDTSFGNGGTNYINQPLTAGGTNASVNAVGLQSDGKIVLGGRTVVAGGATRFLVMRFTVNGQLDTTFGGQAPAIPGVAVVGSIAGGADDTGKALIVQPDDKIILSGYTLDGGGTYHFGIARFLADGTLDETFGGFPTPAPVGATYINQAMVAGATSAGAYAMALLSNGNIIVGGSSTSGGGEHFAVARFLSNGALDTTFGGQDGALVGTAWVSGYIAGVVPGGTLNDRINALVIAPDGAIVCAGYSNNRSYFAIARFLANGTLDTTFGGFPTPAPAGTTYITPRISGTGATVINQVYAIALQPDGKIILAGDSGIDPNFYFAMARLSSNGVLDTTFGGFPSPAPAGTLYLTPRISNLVGGDDRIYALSLLSDGQLIAAGYSNDGGGPCFALAKLTNNYTLTTYQDEYPNQGGFY